MAQALPQPPPPSPPAAAPGLVLTPVPAESCDLQAARDYLAVEIGMNKPGTGEADPDLTERLDGLMAAASATVEEYAPGAPQAIRNEAMVRYCGYLRQSDYGGIRREEIGPKNTEYVVNHAAMFRNSGAMALLTPWKVRRGGAIG